MSELKDLLGENIIKQNDDNVDAASLGGEGRVLGIYFSAHWCPPCRGFTPKLVDFYKKLKAAKEHKMEIVFVSSDRDQKQFDEYFKEMPWLAMAYPDRERKAQLSKKFKVSGIPTLVFVDGHGKLITSDGRSCVGDDPEGKDFPWTPKALPEVMAGTLVKNDKSETKFADLTGVKAFYFSAHWCPPCKAFTPKLAETYKKLKADGKDFEIIFVSSDQSEEQFTEYFGEMPWVAIPFNDPRCKVLSRHFSIDGIPSMIVLDAENNTITTNGRAAISADPEGKEFPWLPKPVNELTGNTAQPINEAACLIVFTDGSDGEKKAAAAALKKKGDEFYKKTGDQDLYFFYAGDDELVESLRDYLKLKDDSAKIIISMLEDQTVFSAESSDVTEANICKFVDDYVAKKIEGKKFR